MLNVTDEILDGHSSVDVSTATSEPVNKLKHEDAGVKLIDNKKKHMERTLSAAQRDQILFKESKEDMNVKKETTQVMKESSRNNVNAISEMTAAIEKD